MDLTKTLFFSFCSSKQFMSNQIRMQVRQMTKIFLIRKHLQGGREDVQRSKLEILNQIIELRSVFKKISLLDNTSQDCLITEGSPAVITGRFSYGFFDVAMLTGETIELQIRSDISENGWETVDSKDTDSSGRVSFTLPSGRYKSVGLYHFRLTVTGDNSSCSCSLAIVPSKSKCVVFSIDSSFAGSGTFIVYN